MVRPVDVRDDEIFEAGVRLQAAQQRVTGYALRRELGERGRPDRLAQVWQVSQRGGSPALGASAPALPPVLEERRIAVHEQMAANLDGLLGQVWGAAMELAESRTREERESVRRELKEALSELAEASTSLATADERLASASAELEALRTVHAAQQREAAEERGRLLATAEAAREEAARERAERIAVQATNAELEKKASAKARSPAASRRGEE